MMQIKQVCPREPLSKDRFSKKLAQAWGRVWPQIGKGKMADAMGLADSKTIDRAVTGANVPEAHTVFNSLCADPTALDEVLKEYGYRLCPVTAQAANDLITAAGIIGAMGALIEALADGRRDHNETLAIAALIRPHMPAIQSIVHEADVLRGAA